MLTSLGCYISLTTREFLNCQAAALVLRALLHDDLTILMNRPTGALCDQP